MAPEEDAMTTAPQTTRFLLVEDDDDHAELVRLAMSRLGDGCALERVRDGEAALDYLHKRAPYAGVPRPDVVLLDLNMPRMGGLEVVERMKMDSGIALIPVIVLTTSDAASDRAMAYRSAVNSYVVKPLEFDRFQGMVQDLGRYWSVWNRSPSCAA